MTRSPRRFFRVAPVVLAGFVVTLARAKIIGGD